MNTKIIRLTFILSLVLFSCSNNSKEESGIANSEVSQEYAPSLKEKKVAYAGYNSTTAPLKKTEDIDNNQNNLTTNKKKIIKDGSISITTKNIVDSKKNLDVILKKLKAYYESEENYDDAHFFYYHLKIRVPSENFESFISAIENGKDEITNKSINVRDVTEEYVDIETRLINKKAYLKRYQELLSKANTIKEILEVEEKIRALEEEIESKVGRLKYLSDQVGFSTLTLHLKKEKVGIAAKPEDGFFQKAGNALSNGLQSSISFILWLISIWPFLICVTVVGIILKRILKNRKG